MTGSLRDKLNPMYAKLFASPGVFDRPEIVETRATCDSCAMCDQGQVAPVDMDYFRPDTKCCTWYPTLPNYLVGAILADESEELAEGRRRLRGRIASRIGITPQFLSPPRKYPILYDAARGSTAFGRSKTLLCPYFDSENGGRCTVWRYRESVCSTYFCKHTNGKPGWQLWNAMKAYLAHVERTLAYAAQFNVDATLRQPTIAAGQLSVEDLEDRAPSDVDYASWWGKWVGREEEFYVACYRRSLAATPAEFSKVVDDTPDGRKCLAELEARHDAIFAKTVLPASLVRAKTRSRHAGDNVVVTTYNAYDAFSIEKELYDVLGMFDGAQSLEANLARLDKEHDIQLAPELLQYLYTHGLLTEPELPKNVPPPRSPHAQALPVRPNREARRAEKAKKKAAKANPTR